MRKVKMIDIDETVSREDSVFVQQSNDDGYHEITNLPSKGKLYPEGTRITGRPFTVREVKKLATMNENNYHQVIKDVLSGCIRGINIDSIVVSDKIYIIFWIRANTYKDANFTTPYTCEHCGRETEYTFDVGAFEFTYLSETFKPSDLTIQLMNGSILELSYLTIADEDRISRFRVSMKSGLSQYDDLDIAIASMIRTINGKPTNIKSACEYIDGIDPSSWAQLSSFVSKIDFGVQPVIDAECRYQDCRGVSQVKVMFRSDFFIPNYNA